jgi:hypothetical protein
MNKGDNTNGLPPQRTRGLSQCFVKFVSYIVMFSFQFSK